MTPPKVAMGRGAGCKPLSGSLQGWMGIRVQDLGAYGDQRFGSFAFMDYWLLASFSPRVERW